MDNIFTLDVVVEEFLVDQNRFEHDTVYNIRLSEPLKHYLLGLYLDARKEFRMDYIGSEALYTQEAVDNYFNLLFKTARQDALMGSYTANSAIVCHREALFEVLEKPLFECIDELLLPYMVD